ncbi:hypothetical protein E3E14_25155 [Streptomyces sp. ICN441]|uniref:hypothetical protein n=1 Tax=Streptomyces sp. ICN441 TaxID=2558286 RepID=UPI00106B0D1E|nr:hypothetical protein [Streptomyces sp. ICN441]TFE42475.1 hypothetical protein E3E14_25155 [Streptomyces sp. ICN441]
MTTSPTPAERLALKTAHAAMLTPAASYDLVSTIIFALGAAGLLMDPETAEELRRLRAQMGAARSADAPIAYALTQKADAIPADPRRAASVAEVQALLARQREDAYTSPLQRGPHPVPHDLPEARP